MMAKVDAQMVASPTPLAAQVAAPVKLVEIPIGKT